MSADDQTFLDTLAAVPNDVLRYSNDVAEYVDKHLESVARSLRETLSSSPWIPESARPRAPPRPPAPLKRLPVGLYKRMQNWVWRHKVLVGTTVLGLGVATLYAYQQQRSYGKKRRAKRATNGARIEVVVIVGSMSESIVKSVALDLERRGFIVLIVCSDLHEESLVLNEGRNDIRPLSIDFSDSVLAGAAVERLSNYLRTPQHAFEGAGPHHLIFNSLILIPSLIYPSAPIATISPTHFSDLLNTRLLQPMIITQAFLPLLTVLPFKHPHQSSSVHTSSPQPHILLLTPSIIQSLSPPFHGPESLVISSLSSFFTTLRSELDPLSIPITHLRLGSFDFSSLHPRNQVQLQNQHFQAQRAETLSWPEGARQAYARNFIAVSERGVGGPGVRGSPARVLHNAVFDAMAKRQGGVLDVGAGSRTYGLVGSLMPRGLIGWIMGVRKVDRSIHSGIMSNLASPGSAHGSETGGDLRESHHSENEYVSVFGGGEER